jgi:hypothetical protein
MRWSNLRILVAVLATIALTTVFRPLAFLETASQPQQEPCRVFKETQRTICGRFLQHWQQNGGLPVFGYPISNEFPEVSDLDNKERMVQYFERAVFERHTENKPPYDVLLSQLGSRQFKDRYNSGNAMGSYPLYPNAEQVSLKREITEVTLRFTTKDSSAAVMTFYMSTLPPMGWVFDQRQDNRAWYYYSPSDLQAQKNPHLPPGAGYGLLIETTQGSRGETTVEIDASPQYIP